MKRLAALFLSIVTALPIMPVSAAGKAAKFELTIAQAAKVGEALDLTVKVLGSDNAVVTDYAGTVYVTVDNDSKATLPYAEGYTFVAADQGQKTFSKGLAFSKVGNMNVSVIDIDDDKVEGTAKVNVTEAGAVGPVGKESVTVTSPENGGTVTGSDADVIGVTKKNSKFQVFLNGKKAGESQTDDQGNFLYKLKGIDQEQNVLEVKVLDGSDAVAGSSDKISFKLAADTGPALRSVTIAEGKSVLPGTILNVTVLSDAKLKEVSVAFGDSVEVFKEQTVTTATGTSEGTYVGQVTAPSKPGDYPLDVTLTNDMAKKTVKTAAETVTVTEPPKVAYENVKVEISDKKASFTFDVANEPANAAKFKFSYGLDAASMTGESVTFDKDKIRSGTGNTYKWYVSGLTELKKYAFKIVALDAAGSVITGSESDVIDADLSLNAAGKCSVSNISGIQIAKTDETSKLTWDAVPEAQGYNVYKKDASGTFVLVENVKSNEYVIHLAKGAVKYEDFGIKAVCADGTAESADYAEVTKVPTGPGKILFLITVALGLGLFITRRRLGLLK